MYKYAALTLTACFPEPFPVIASLGVAIIHIVPLVVSRNVQAMPQQNTCPLLLAITAAHWQAL